MVVLAVQGRFPPETSLFFHDRPRLAVLAFDALERVMKRIRHLGIRRNANDVHVRPALRAGQHINRGSVLSL